MNLSGKNKEKKKKSQPKKKEKRKIRSCQFNQSRKKGSYCYKLQYGNRKQQTNELIFSKNNLSLKKN